MLSTVGHQVKVVCISNNTEKKIVKRFLIKYIKEGSNDE